jgi:hypothetical protein
MLPRPTTLGILKTVFWNRWGALVGTLWALVGVLDGIDDHVAPRFPDFKVVWDRFYVLPSFSSQTWVTMLAVSLLILGLHGAYSYAMSFSKRYEELTKNKIEFDVDEGKSKVSFADDLLVAGIVIQFENKDIHPWTMKGLDFSLHRTVGKKVEDIFTMLNITYAVSGIDIPKDQFEGMLIPDGRVTPFYEAKVGIHIIDKEFVGFENMGYDHFIRISMDASNQPRFSRDYVFSSIDMQRKTASLFSFSQLSSSRLIRRVRHLN